MHREAVHIRELSDRDSITDLTDLLHRAYKPLLDMGLRYVATYQSEDDTRKRISRGICWVAVLDDRVVGTATYHVRPNWPGVPWVMQPGVALVGQFAVEPALQQHGIGSRLLEHVEQTAARDGARELALSTAESAAHLIAYYTKRGYRFVEFNETTQPRYRSVILSKTLGTIS